MPLALSPRRIAHMLAHREPQPVTLPGHEAPEPEPAPARKPGRPPRVNVEPEPEVERVIDADATVSDVVDMLRRTKFERGLLTPVYINGPLAARHLLALLLERR